MIRDAERNAGVGALTLGGGFFPAPAPAPAPTGVVSLRAAKAAATQVPLTQVPTAQLVAPTSFPTLTPKTAASLVSVVAPSPAGMMSITQTFTPPPPKTVPATPVTGGGPDVRVPVPSPPQPAQSTQCPPGQYWSGYACLDNGSTSSLLPAGFSGGSGGGITTAPPQPRGTPAFTGESVGDDATPGGGVSPQLALAPQPVSKTTVYVVAGVGAAALAVGLGVLLARSSRSSRRERAA